MSRPKVEFKTRTSIFDSSAYYVKTEKIVILDTPHWVGSLYHEYRHHWQFTNLPIWFLAWASLGMLSTYLFIGLCIVAIAFKLKLLALISGAVYLTLILPVFAMEADANIFALYRIVKKKRKLQNFLTLIVSILTYSYSYVYFPIIMIEHGFNNFQQ